LSSCKSFNLDTLFDTEIVNQLNNTSVTSDNKSDTIAKSNDNSCADSDTLLTTGVENKDDFVTLQRADPALAKLLGQVVSEPFPVGRSCYYLSNDILMHHQVDHLHLNLFVSAF
jgi:hypothetical protein